MTAVYQRQFKGCGRGIFGLSSWEPLRKPGTPFSNSGQCATQEKLTRNQEILSQTFTNQNFNNQVQTQTFTSQSFKNQESSQIYNDQGPTQTFTNQGPNQVFNNQGTTQTFSNQRQTSAQENTSSVCKERENITANEQGKKESKSRSDDSAPIPPKEGSKIMAKFRYKANPHSPLGEEITLEAGQVLIYKAAHPANEHWWYATSPDGLKGYVPALYMMEVVEEKLTSLPWLSAPVQEEPQGNNTFGLPEKPVWKPYKSSYKHEGLPQDKQYYCEICAKQLNGPAPYDAHMKSKGHKEEVELSKEYGRL